MKKIAISACLTGKNVRYDGTNKENKQLMKLLEGQEIIEICPEVLSGFKIPHSPIEINNDKVIDSNNNDYTDMLNKGCKIALEKIKDCDFVILKSKSPSCGYQKIYDGTFQGRLIDGNGVFARMCLENKIKVFNEEDFHIISQLIK